MLVKTNRYMKMHGETIKIIDVFDMFRTTKCSSSGRLCKQLYGTSACIYISSLVAVRMCLYTLPDDEHLVVRNVSKTI